MQDDCVQKAPYEPPQLLELGKVGAVTHMGPGVFMDGTGSVS